MVEKVTLQANSEQIRRLVLDYFHLLGAGIEDCGDDLYRVELNQEQVSELEGRPHLVPWNPQNGTSLTTYYFTFTPREDLPPEVECITLGSQRLYQIITSVRRQAEVSHIWVPIHGDRDRGTPDGRAPLSQAPGATGQLTLADMTYRPFCLFLFRLDPFPGPGPTSIVRIGVDMVDGIALRKLAELVLHMDVCSGFPDDPDVPIEEMRIDLDEAFKAAYSELISGLSSRDLITWAHRQQETVQRETDRLQAYFREHKAQDDALSPDEQKRIDELKALSPKVVARVQNMTLAHLPVSHVDGTPDYLPLAKYLAF